MSAKICKVVMVTGSSRGIGAGIAKSFSKQGVCLSLSSIDEDNFDNVVKECKSHGAKEILKSVTDLTKQENMDMVMKNTIEKFGRLDVLVNNAGILRASSIGPESFDHFDKIFHLNVRTPYYLTQLAAPYLEKTKGCIINISSVASKIVDRHLALYCMTKCAVDHLTRVSALDLARKGVRVNSVNPTVTDTAMVKGMSEVLNIEESTLRKNAASLIPLGKLGRIEDVADAVVFLASDTAQMITGSNLLVDGGQVCRL